MKVRIGYIVNLLLTITFIFALISGISTSQVLFPADSHGSAWRGIHHFSGAVAIILVGIHLGLHWTFISGMFKKFIKINKTVAKILSIVLLIIVLSFGVYSTVTSSFTSWLAEPFVTSVKTEDNKSGGDMNNHTPKSDENKAPRNSVSGQSESVGNGETMTKHDDSTKTVETSPMNFINTILKFVSIMAIFATLTYYIEKLCKTKKKKK